MLRGGIIGLGNVALHGHLPGWLSRGDVEIVAVSDTDPDRRAVWASATRAHWHVTDRLCRSALASSASAHPVEPRHTHREALTRRLRPLRGSHWWARSTTCVAGGARHGRDRVLHRAQLASCSDRASDEGARGRRRHRSSDRRAMAHARTRPAAAAPGEAGVSIPRSPAAEFSRIWGGTCATSSIADRRAALAVAPRSRPATQGFRWRTPRRFVSASPTAPPRSC
jgi:hypothetical protein